MSFKQAAANEIASKLFSRAVADRALEEGPLTRSCLGYYLCHFMRKLGKGYAYLLLFDKRMCLMKSVRLKHGGNETYDSTLQKTQDTVEKWSPSYIAVAHNHISSTTPSAADRRTTHMLKERYNSGKTVFIGHYIISGLDYLVLEPNGNQNYRTYDKIQKGV